LPIVLIGFFLIGGKGHHRIAISWLVAASLFFYGWWNPAYLGLMLASIFFNYAIGISLVSGKPSKPLLIFGIIANLGALGYFKYANFFVDNLNYIASTNFHLETIILPLAISFFTFQQITYLVDAYRGETREYNFLHYGLFVSFFPQLIAGPIVHHREMLPQFSNNSIYKPNHENLAIGFIFFFIGLFKKVVIADGLAIYASPIFIMVANGDAISFSQAWSGALAYTFQLYFDFSGYSDMAIGLARMFGVKLPLNFHSPYKAINIIDFWKRWHMTLSRFLRDYVYIPLGGNRKGKTRRYINLMIAMLVGGLWHGAAWTFVMWGALHGIYIVINHAWHGIRRKLGHNLDNSTILGRGISWLLMFIAVVIGWVFFRSENFNSAILIIETMFGLSGFDFPELGIEWNIWYFILLSFLLVKLMPNTQQIMNHYEPALDTYFWKTYSGKIKLAPTLSWVIIIVFIAVSAILGLGKESEFLYFQF